MTRVYADMGISLDGFVAGTNRGPKNPLGDRGRSIHGWLFEQRAFREHLGLGDDGDTGDDDRVVRRMFERIGANVMGKRMFEEGEVSWPENAPFHNDVFVLTHERRAPWPRPGGTTFHFVNEGIEDAVRRARAVCGGKDVRISGGADVVRQAFAARLVEELVLHVGPIVLGEGLRLFDGVDRDAIALEPTSAVASDRVTHLAYAVRYR